MTQLLTLKEYQAIAVEKITPISQELYRYLNFNEIPGFENHGADTKKQKQLHH